MFGIQTTYETLLDEFRRMEQDMDEFFGRWTGPAGIRSVSRGVFPAINVGATSDAVSVYLFAPGLDAKSFDISIQQNLLLVSGKRRLPLQEKGTYYRQERIGGDFRRVITLPDDVDADRVEASYCDGVLQIGLKRKETARPRQIHVN
jgi:HSP20 family protein